MSMGRSYRGQCGAVSIYARIKTKKGKSERERVKQKDKRSEKWRERRRSQARSVLCLLQSNRHKKC